MGGPVRRLRVWCLVLGIAALFLADGSSRDSADAELPGPQLGASVVVEPVSGTVFVKTRRAEPVAELIGRRQIPVGSTVDVTKGEVRLTAAGLTGSSTQSGQFSGGAFLVTQERSALTDLVLTEGHRRSQACAHAARQASLSSSVLRRLHSKVSGNFRTQGDYASVTVRGTEFTTEDRCDGTFVVDEEGSVTVRDRAGQEPARGALHPGDTSLTICRPPGTVQNFYGTGGDYCVDLTSEPKAGVYGFGIITRRPARTFGVCVRGPSGRRHCQEADFWPSGEAGVREQIIVCSQEGGTGPHVANYLIDGKLAAELRFDATVPYESTELGAIMLFGEGFCTVHFGGESPRSPNDLWATVNVCRPGAVGLGVSMPGTGDRHEEMLARFRLQRQNERGEWQFVPSADTGYTAIGNARPTVRRAKWVFQLPASEGTGLMRGVVELKWREKDSLGTYTQAEISTITVGGHPLAPGAQPRNFTSATCKL
jgi:hypothetical protein